MATPRSSVIASSAARRSTSRGWTPCPMPGFASPARRKRKMANVADPMVPGAERRVFLTAAVGTVVLDLITKVIAEATLLRTPGISVFGDWFLLAVDLLHRGSRRRVRPGADVAHQSSRRSFSPAGAGIGGRRGGGESHRPG